MVERMQLGNLFFEAIYNFTRLERSFCRKADIYYGQPRILTVLTDHEGKTLTELSPICGIGLPSLSVSLRNLQKSGLIRKVGSGKRQKIYLTETGRERALLFHNQMEEFYKACMEELGTDCTDQLYQNLEKFSNFTERYVKNSDIDTDAASDAEQG